jgi:putative ABC transport system permease protein
MFFGTAFGFFPENKYILSMRKDYIKTAIRRLIRNRTISIINILGLSLGLAATFLIMLYIFFETGFDSQHKKSDRIYRIIQESKGHDMHTSQSAYPLGDVLKEQYPQITETVRMVNLYGTGIKKGDDFISEDHFYCAENSFFEIFTTELIRGNDAKLTTDPDNVVLTKSMALKYFGKTEVLGKQLLVRNAGEEISLNVSGVIEDFPENSSFRPDFIASMDLGLRQLPKLMSTSNDSVYTAEYLKSRWGFGYFTTFILTNKNFNEDFFGTEFRKIEKKYLDNPESLNYHLQKLEDVYFQSDNIFASGFQSGNLTSVYIFAGIGVLILLIACINYVLLNTSQALERSKEIGVRKITGATKKSLFNQVLVESLIVTLIAFPLALILIEQFRPVIIRFMEKNFVQYNLNLEIILSIVGILFIITYLPGMFTMRYFSRITPVFALRGGKNNRFQSYRGKKLLISVQFVIFLMLVSSSISIYKQIHYSKNHDLGFNPEGIITFNTTTSPGIRNSYSAFKEQLLRHDDILSVSGGLWVPPTPSRMTVDISRLDDPEQKIKLDGLYVDKDFLKTLDIKLLQGKTLSEFGDNYANKIIINETALKQSGLENPIGKKLNMGEIAGVMEDFHYHSFKRKIPPLILIGNKGMIREVLIKTKGNNIPQVRSYIQETFADFTGKDNVQLSYLTDNFDKIYKSERKLATLISFFAGLAILIASMGLLGLTIFTLKKRTKEIAIRKVNGANIRHILAMISLEYIRLIIYALLVTVPVSYFLMDKWLQEFAYKTTISWWIYAFAGFIALAITLITISFKAIKAANKNPVESLRYE